MQREMEKEMQNMFGDLEKQLEGVQKLAAEKRRETEQKGRDIMPKLLKQKTAFRVEAFEYIAEAINQGIPIDAKIYETLFDQYDSDNSGSLSMEQIKKLIKEVAMSEVKLCEHALTSGELEKQLEGNPMGGMMLPMIRGQVETKKRIAQAKVEHIETSTAEEIKQKLDVTGDGKVTKTEFMSKIEQTFWFEQQMSAQMQQSMGFGGGNGGGAPPECQQQ